MSETAGQSLAIRFKAYPCMIDGPGMEERFQNALRCAFQRRRRPRKTRAPVQRWGHLTSMRVKISSEYERASA